MSLKKNYPMGLKSCYLILVDVRAVIVDGTYQVTMMWIQVCWLSVGSKTSFSRRNKKSRTENAWTYIKSWDQTTTRISRFTCRFTLENFHRSFWGFCCDLVDLDNVLTDLETAWNSAGNESICWGFPAEAIFFFTQWILGKFHRYSSGFTCRFSFDLQIYLQIFLRIYSCISLDSFLL